MHCRPLTSGVAGTVSVTRAVRLGKSTAAPRTVGVRVFSASSTRTPQFSWHSIPATRSFTTFSRGEDEEFVLLLPVDMMESDPARRVKTEVRGAAISAKT